MQPPAIGQRLTDKSVRPDSDAVRDWIGPDAFRHWAALQERIEASYPGVFAPEWLYGGRKHGWSLRYKKSKALCTFVPEYRRFSVVVVLGSAEREKFEARRESWRTRLLELYDATETLHDGKWLKVEVSSADDQNDVIELLALKRRAAKAREQSPET